MTSTNSSHIAITSLFESARMNGPLDDASQSHLADCALCRDRLGWMQTAAQLGAHESQYEPPQSAMDQVLRLGRSGPGYLKKLRNFIVASLTFDSFSNLTPIGVRRTEARSRQMTYRADDLEIAVSLGPSDNNRITLTGQVLRTASKPVEDPSARVDLVVDGDHISSSPLSPWGEFVFPDLTEAQYTLQVHVLDRVVRIQELPSSRQA